MCTGFSKMGPEQDIPPAYSCEKQSSVSKGGELESRLARLQEEIKDAKVDWYVVPSEDEHQSEGVGESDQRRYWISGCLRDPWVAHLHTRFKGSAGTALIPASAHKDALLFVDARYWIQAEKQVPKSGWKVRRVGSTDSSGRVVGGWQEALVDDLADGSRVGIDPKLIALSAVTAIQASLANSATKLIPLHTNLVDRIRETPPRSLGPLFHHEKKYTGEETPSKLKRIRAELDKKAGKDEEWAYILPSLPANAWLLNYRCTSDIPCLPVAYTYVVITKKQAVVFVDGRKVPQELLRLWKEEGVEIRDYGVGAVGAFIHVFAHDHLDDKKQVRVFAPKELSWGLAEACAPTPVQVIPCPVDVAKGAKNATEVQGFRNAYLRDGRAMVRWLAWLDKRIVQDKKPIKEWDAAQVLTRYRQKENLFAGLAYTDIVGSGPNGALPHYAPKQDAQSVIDPDSTLVVDSGGQYLDATIDTTRTMYFGKNPPEDVKRAYTRVLQCHIAAATGKFPSNVDASQLVMLGKAALYQDGLDYGHGLGHGIGQYLAVHEYPIYPRGTSFVPGNITSIEPGFYKEGEWGIRLESVYVCKHVETKYEFGGANWLGWERLTQVPLFGNLVDWKLTSKHEMRWINEHNTAVKEALWPLLQGPEDAATRKWLQRVCKPKTVWPWNGQ